MPNTYRTILHVDRSQNRLDNWMNQRNRNCLNLNVLAPMELPVLVQIVVETMGPIVARTIVVPVEIEIVAVFGTKLEQEKPVR